MTGWIVSSCALILAVLLLRLAAGNKISARVRCWLWAAVAVRLLVPGMAFSGPAGVVNALPERFSGETVYTSPVTQSSPAPVTSQTAVSSETAAAPASPELRTQPTQAREINWGVLLPEIWKYGALAAAVWFALGNLRLYAGLRKTRRRLDMEAGGVPVYETDMIKSPCLFGFFRPAIYLTPRAAEYGRADWVLKHELAHLRRGDNWLCLARCLCLAVWWWNPLAWLAEAKSREDGELACDEAVTAAMSREERLSYGGALLDMVAVGRASAGLSKAAAMMTAGGREMKKPAGGPGKRAAIPRPRRCDHAGAGACSHRLRLHRRENAGGVRK
jgi:beta-lactamase regulating signal transducer with metallopeptidase domain